MRWMRKLKQGRNSCDRSSVSSATWRNCPPREIALDISYLGKTAARLNPAPENADPEEESRREEVISIHDAEVFSEAVVEQLLHSVKNASERLTTARNAIPVLAKHHSECVNRYPSDNSRTINDGMKALASGRSLFYDPERDSSVSTEYFDLTWEIGELSINDTCGMEEQRVIHLLQGRADEKGDAESQFGDLAIITGQCHDQLMYFDHGPISTIDDATVVGLSIVDLVKITEMVNQFYTTKDLERRIVRPDVVDEAM